MKTVKTFATFSRGCRFALLLNSLKNTETKIRAASLCLVYRGSCCLPTPPSVETVFRSWHRAKICKNRTCHCPKDSKNLLPTDLSLFNTLCVYSTSIWSSLQSKSQPYVIWKLASQEKMHKMIIAKKWRKC